ncbi:MAG: polysaccharide pyruvyl transferase family protein [Desulfobacteraceae bacterium]|nr:polysaccharide pyruvyl transferase family protein [Desulfobacteraceae bacterium]
MHRALIRKILILAGDVTGNLGDAAIALSTCDQIRARIKDVEISFVADPARAGSMFPDAQIVAKGLCGLPAQVKAAFQADLIICGGGGLFQDDDSLVKMPYWAVRIFLVKMLGGQVVGYCLGVGPLTRRLSRFFCRMAFSCMSVVSVRDPVAIRLADRLAGGRAVCVPDPAIALIPASPEAAQNLLHEHRIPDDGSPVIGVAVRKWFHKRGSVIPNKAAFRLGLKSSLGGSRLEEMTGRIAGVLDRLVFLYNAYIVFLPTYNLAHEGDDRVCAAIAGKMHSGRSALIKIADPRLYKAVSGRLSVMLAARMHPAIFAASMGTPVVGLAYNPKFNGFFQLMKCPDKVIAIEDFVEKDMTEQLFRLIEISLGENNQSLADTASDLAGKYRDFNDAVFGR